MNDSTRDVRELTFLYDWMRLARKPTYNCRQDLKLMFQLIAIPITESELAILERSINPNGDKTELSQQDLLDCLVVEEEQRKTKEK